MLDAPHSCRVVANYQGYMLSKQHPGKKERLFLKPLNKSPALYADKLTPESISVGRERHEPVGLGLGHANQSL